MWGLPCRPPLVPGLQSLGASCGPHWGCPFTLPFHALPSVLLDLEMLTHPSLSLKVTPSARSALSAQEYSGFSEISASSLPPPPSTNCLSSSWTVSSLGTRTRSDSAPGPGTGHLGQRVPDKRPDALKVKVSQSCPTLCDPMDCSLPDSSVHGILLAIIMQWVAGLLSRGSSQPRDRTQVSCIASGFLTI